MSGLAEADCGTAPECGAEEDKVVADLTAEVTELLQG